MSRRSPGLTPYEANVFARRGSAGLDFSGLGGFSSFNAVAPVVQQAPVSARPQAEPAGAYNLAFYTFRIPTTGIWRIEGAAVSGFHKWFKGSEEYSAWPANFVAFLGASPVDAEAVHLNTGGYVSLRPGLLFVLADSEPTVTFIEP